MITVTSADRERGRLFQKIAGIIDKLDTEKKVRSTSTSD
jgi:hypothetical protein